MQQRPRATHARCAWRALTLLLSAWASTGCTLIGLGVGSGVPKDQEFRGPAFQASKDSEVTAHLVSPLRYPEYLCGTQTEHVLEETTPRAFCGAETLLPTVTGTFRRNDGRHLWIQRGDYLIGLRPQDVDHLTQESSYWVTGALVGAALDVIAIAALGAGAIAEGAGSHANEN